jgi:hypothetical protein
MSNIKRLSRLHEHCNLFSAFSAAICSPLTVRKHAGLGIHRRDAECAEGQGECILFSAYSASLR